MYLPRFSFVRIIMDDYFYARMSILPPQRASHADSDECIFSLSSTLVPLAQQMISGGGAPRSVKDFIGRCSTANKAGLVPCDFWKSLRVCRDSAETMYKQCK